MIIDFTFTRTFSTHNAKMTTHEKIYHELVHSMTENTIYITSNKNQGSVPWTKKLGTMHLGDLGVGRESFTVQNVHESVLSVGLSV